MRSLLGLVSYLMGSRIASLLGAPPTAKPHLTRLEHMVAHKIEMVPVVERAAIVIDADGTGGVCVHMLEDAFALNTENQLISSLLRLFGTRQHCAQR